ncbi:MAG: hypothetical protein U0W40_12735 [Acidimicrobiia bacterium]
MSNEHPTRRKRSVEPHVIAPDVGGFIDDDGVDEDAARHYHGDPNHLLQFAAVADERHVDYLLEVDQVELAELGLVLDDPHQPDRD